MPLGQKKLKTATKRKEKSSRYELKKRSSTGMFVNRLTRQLSNSDKSQLKLTNTTIGFLLNNAN